MWLYTNILLFCLVFVFFACILRSFVCCCFVVFLFAFFILFCLVLVVRTVEKWSTTLSKNLCEGVYWRTLSLNYPQVSSCDLHQYANINFLQLYCEGHEERYIYVLNKADSYFCINCPWLSVLRFLFFFNFNFWFCFVLFCVRLFFVLSLLIVCLDYCRCTFWCFLNLLLLLLLLFAGFFFVKTKKRKYNQTLTQIQKTRVGMFSF